MLPLPGTRSSEAVIGSATPRRCASVSGTRSGLGMFGGSATYSLTAPPADQHAHFIVFLVGDDARRIGRRHQLAGRRQAARRALALAAGEDPHQRPPSCRWQPRVK